MADPFESEQDRLDAENAATNGDGGDEAAKLSIAGQADVDDGEDPEGDPQQELFVVEHGRQVTFSQLVKRGVAVENRYAMSGKSIANVSGGLVDPFATSVMLVADCVVDHVKPTYIRDAQQRVEKVVLYVSLKPRRVQQALSEAGQVMLAEARQGDLAAVGS